MTGPSQSKLIAISLRETKWIALSRRRAKDRILDESISVPDGANTAITHAFFWMFMANGVGIALAWLLLVPSSGYWMGELTYGRWIPVHLNLHLYGWTSLPLVAWLLRLYAPQDDHPSAAARASVWAWSMSLMVGAIAWLHGETSGKIFLDWIGLARVLYPTVMLFLWSVLFRQWWANRQVPGWAPVVQMVGLLILASVPMAVFWASGREVYPAVNADSGGPTGMSLLGSTLIVVLLLLLVPQLQNRATWGQKLVIPRLCWLTFLFQVGIVMTLGFHHATHHDWHQWLGLGTLASWIILMPLYYRGFLWPPKSMRWQRAMLFWFGLLVATGWLSFLPKVLDHLKFTDALVAHTHLAMAGFVTSFNLFLIGLLAPSSLADHIHRPIAFWLWNGATATYVIVMWVAGAFEGADPSFTIIRGIARELLYAIRFTAGLVLFCVSLIWWRAARSAMIQR